MPRTHQSRRSRPRSTSSSPEPAVDGQIQDEASAGLSRRAMLKGLGVAAAGAALAACSSSGSSKSSPSSSLPRPTSTTAPPVRRPGSLPNPKLPEGTDTLPQIEHIVVLMMENHSYDDHFGMLKRGDGFKLGSDGLPLDANPYEKGKLLKAFHMPSSCQLEHVPDRTGTRATCRT